MVQWFLPKTARIFLKQLRLLDDKSVNRPQNSHGYSWDLGLVLKSCKLGSHEIDYQAGCNCQIAQVCEDPGFHSMLFKICSMKCRYMVNGC